MFYVLILIDKAGIIPVKDYKNLFHPNTADSSQFARLERQLLAGRQQLEESINALLRDVAN